MTLMSSLPAGSSNTMPSSVRIVPGGISRVKNFRNNALRGLLDSLDPRINLEFNPYFLDMAMQQGLHIIECPVSFHPRVGTSKGGNVSNWIATKLGVRMVLGILSNWKGLTRDG